QRLERDEREAELHAALGAPHEAGHDGHDPGDGPHDDPDGLQRNPERDPRLVVVRHRSQGPADARSLEEQRQQRDQHRRRHRRRQLELVDLHAADDERAIGDPDVELLDVGAPQHLPEPLEEEVEADGGHEQDDVLLVHEGAQHDPLELEGQCQHHGARRSSRRTRVRAANSTITPWAKLNTPEALKISTKPSATSEYMRPANRPPISTSTRNAGEAAMSLNGATSAAESTSRNRRNTRSSRTR